MNENKLIWVALFALKHPVIFIRLLLKCTPSLSVRSLILRNELLILFHKSVYHFYLCRKRLILFVLRFLIRLNLFACERKLIAKHGANWRLRVLNNEAVEFRELIKDYRRF